MLPRRTNLALGALLVAAVLTGLLANTIGVDWPLDPIAVHGAAALGVLLLAPWKSAIVRRGWRRRRPRRWWSLVLLGLVATALASGLAHATGVVEQVGPLTVMQVHVGAAVLALAVLAGHVRAHPVRPRRTDLDRRAFLSAAVLSAGAAVALTGWEAGLNAVGGPGGQRRFTGSVQRGSGDPAAMPAVAWLNDRIPAIDPERWRLRAGTAGFDLTGLRALPHEEFRAVLDCTGGWYAEQTWSGVRLDRLIRPDEPGWRSVEVRSATGYALHFPWADLDRLWLVTAVGGAPLAARHGYPARIVAPGRRGFWWVKWVVSIQPSTRPWWLQSPFPLS